MRRLIWTATALFITLVAAPLRAQSADEKAVLDVVTRLFDGMRTRDTTAMRTAFAPGAQMWGISRTGEIQGASIDGWIGSISQIPAGQDADEVLHDPEVRIDGAIATVWTYYDLFLGERFLHCGYDAFQLVKTQGAWKIVSVTDTRRQEGCRKERRQP
jgi:hypothetical protein